MLNSLCLKRIKIFFSQGQTFFVSRTRICTPETPGAGAGVAQLQPKMSYWVLNESFTSI
jgi:hypothetical protein